MRRSLLVSATLLAAAAIAAASASAGTYPVSACAAFAPQINNSWQPINNNTTYLETPANCATSEVTGGSPNTSGLAAADVLRLSTNVPAGALAGWRAVVPAGDEISAISMNRDLYEQGDGWEPQIVDATGAPLPGETCPFNGNNGGCETSGPAMHTGLSTTSLTIELLCNPAPAQLTVCGNGFSQHDARVELANVTLTVTDEQRPQITSTSGPLFAGGLVHGTLAGTINGTDSSGVQSGRLYVDGAQASQQSLACDFTRPAPCPTSSSNQFNLDTSTLSHGPHQIQAAVVDAAGNQTLGSPVQITVENASPPPAPITPTTSTTTTPSTPSKPALASPGLRILSVRRTEYALHVRGGAASTLSGQITVIVRYRFRGRSHKVQKTIRVAHGKWAAVLGLPRGARTARVTVVYDSSRHWLSQTVTREIHHRARF